MLNDMHIVSETIGCFGQNSTRITPISFNPQVALMARKAAASGLVLNPSVSV